MAGEDERFDPRGVLAALDRNFVGYVVIGGFARAVRGADETTHGVESALHCVGRTWNDSRAPSRSWRRSGRIAAAWCWTRPRSPSNR